MKTQSLNDVLKNDRAQLRSMYQPSMVKEQLQTLYGEYDQLGVVSSKRNEIIKNLFFVPK